MCVNCVYGHISERESAFSCLCWLQLWKLACQKHCCLQGLYKIYSYAYWIQNTLVSHQCVFIVTYPFLNTYYLSIYLELHSGYLKAILDQRTLLTKYLLKCHVVTYFPSILCTLIITIAHILASIKILILYLDIFQSTTIIVFLFKHTVVSLMHTEPGSIKL